MENNNVIINKPKSKVGMMMLIIVLIILAIIAYMYVKKINDEPTPITKSEMDLNKAVNADSTTSINASLDSIKVDDTSEADMEGVDKELQNL